MMTWAFFRYVLVLVTSIEVNFIIFDSIATQVTVGQLLSGGKYQSIRVGKSVLNIVIKYDD